LVRFLFVNEPSPAPPANAWSVLRRPAFARYISGETVSMPGTWMQQMAQGWVLAGLTSSAFTFGLVATLLLRNHRPHASD
jgi:hypothetical protein